MELKNWHCLLAIIAVSALFLSLNQFQGNYAINDDWLHYVAVRDLIQKGGYSLGLLGTVGMLQIYYGAAVASVFGLNHVVLRLSVILFSVLGVALMYLLFREQEFSKPESVLAALLLLVNPLYYYLSLTFMTDVPFLVLFIASLLFYLKWVKSGQTTNLAIASVIAMISFFIRQYGFFLLLGAAVYCKVSKKDNAKQRNMVYGFLVLGLALLMASALIERSVDTSTGLLGIGDEDYSLLSVPARVLGMPLYIGFFLAPLALLLLGRNARKVFTEKKTRLWIVIALIGFGVLFGLLLMNRAMPYFGDTMNSYGLGEKALAGEKPSVLPQWAWLALTAVSALSFIVLAQLSRLKKMRCDSCKLVAINAGLLFLFLASFNYYFDRFILPLLPLAYLLVFKQLREFKYFKAAIAVTVIAFAVFSFAYTFEYFSWNNARYAAVGSLIEQGIPMDEIDAGHEYCALNFNYKSVGFEARNPCYPKGFEPQYKISHLEIEGYETVEKRPYYSALGSLAGHIYVLKR